MAVQDLLLNVKWRVHWWLNQKSPGCRSQPMESIFYHGDSWSMSGCSPHSYHHLSLSCLPYLCSLVCIHLMYPEFGLLAPLSQPPSQPSWSTCPAVALVLAPWLVGLYKHSTQSGKELGGDSQIVSHTTVHIKRERRHIYPLSHSIFPHLLTLNIFVQLIITFIKLRINLYKPDGYG